MSIRQGLHKDKYNLLNKLDMQVIVFTIRAYDR